MQTKNQNKNTVISVLIQLSDLRHKTYPAIPCSHGILLMALQRVVSCQLIKIYQRTFSSNFVEEIFVLHVKTKVYANRRATESDLQIAQRNTYSGRTT